MLMFIIHLICVLFISLLLFPLSLFVFWWLFKKFYFPYFNFHIKKVLRKEKGKKEEKKGKKEKKRKKKVRLSILRNGGY